MKKRSLILLVTAIVAYTFIIVKEIPAMPASDTNNPAINIEHLDKNMANRDPEGKWLWYDATKLTVEGKGWNDTQSFYHRLPARAKTIVREPVWVLSTQSAGLSVRFMSNSPKIAAKWKVTYKALSMPHMPATGVSGLDLYINDNGRWCFIGSASAINFPQNESVLADGIKEGTYEYQLNLPLYNGVESVEIGITPDSMIAKAPARKPELSKPICFYGTSIVQGGCASRPGMAHPAILGRRLNRPIINLGFSGNATMDLEIADLLAELDVAVYVIDCLPNMTADLVAQRAEPFILKLRKARPTTPILLVETTLCPDKCLPKGYKRVIGINKELKKAFDNLAAKGITQLYYAPTDSLLGEDDEATVDVLHPTDFGFKRIADGLEPILRNILNNRK